ncbi:MAG: hypothetical protein KVP17_003431 [Porospora cf. gigantea B]|uniref:uncharacterized protein n=1 Tax=Porospora cf. gigantea B TaxID=2853592 RepID=UPI00357196A3|nr:MAG: hypothetical protein KVP17_003431 [Porospora cf. gigantea B]
MNAEEFYEAFVREPTAHQQISSRFPADIRESCLESCRTENIDPSKEKRRFQEFIHLHMKHDTGLRAAM